jgi:tetraacyldisaccharide 4'-kinase
MTSPFVKIQFHPINSSDNRLKQTFCEIHTALLPLSWLYGLGVWVRNKLFDWKILPAETFDVPVISVGNLAAGGTGKTPHTEYLIRLLRKKFRVAVLSRGYKRKTRGFVLAGKDACYRSIGDEPYQIYRKFPEVLVAVDANRRRGIRNLLDSPIVRRPNVIILDDAFQHRYVKPSLAVLLTDSRRPFFEDRLLPAGRLREPAYNAERADMIIFTKYNHKLQTANNVVHSHPHVLILQSQLVYKELLPVFPEKSNAQKESLERLRGESYSALLLAGLAHPEDLVQHLAKHISDLYPMIYPDHHDFSQKDIAAITACFNSIPNKKKLILTSEKDAVRLMHCPHLREEIKNFIYYIPIETVFETEQEQLFTQKIENHVTNFKRNRIVAEASDTRRH